MVTHRAAQTAPCTRAYACDRFLQRRAKIASDLRDAATARHGQLEGELRVRCPRGRVVVGCGAAYAVQCPAQGLAAEYHRAASAVVTELQATLTEAAEALKSAHADAVAAEADIVAAAETYLVALNEAQAALEAGGDDAPSLIATAPWMSPLTAAARKCAADGEAKLMALHSAHEADVRKTHTQLATVVAQVRTMKRGGARKGRALSLSQPAPTAEDSMGSGAAGADGDSDVTMSGADDRV